MKLNLQKLPIILSLLAVLISIPATVYLVKQRQELRKRAEEVEVPTEPAIETVDSPFGVHGGPTMLGSNAAEKTTIAQNLYGAGVKWTRQNFGWNGLQPTENLPPEQWNWGGYDQAIQISVNSGLSILADFIGTAKWASTCPGVDEPSPGGKCENFWYRWQPENWDDWENYVRQVVKRYGAPSARNPNAKNQVHYWEIWNEQDSIGFWRVPAPGGPADPNLPELRADGYYELLKRAARAIREEDPQAKVVFGGITSCGTLGSLNPNCPSDVRQVVERILGKPDIGNYFDIFNIHVYEHQGGAAETMQAAKQLLGQYRLTNKPIWVTETNPGPLGDLAAQGRNLTSWYSELLGAGAQKVFWFYTVSRCYTGQQGEFNCTPPNEAFKYAGLLKSSDFSIQPEIYNAYKNMAATGSTYTWEYNGQNYNLKYKFTPLKPNEATATGTLSNLEVTYNNTYTFKPSVKSGPHVILPNPQGQEQEYVPESAYFNRTISSVGFANNVLTVNYVFSKNNLQIPFQYKFSLAGNALKIEASSTNNNSNPPKIPVFNLREPAGTTGLVKTLFQIPYLTAGYRILLHNNIFTSLYFDWTKTGSSNFVPLGGANQFSQRAEYEPKTNGQRNALTETVYLKTSPKIEETFPDIPNQKSPYMNALKDRVVLEIWGGPTASFSAIEQRITRYKDKGITNLLFLNQVWQRFEQYGWPNTIPADEGKGGDAGLKSLGDKAKSLGYLFGVYENYIICDPNEELYTPNLCTSSERSKASNGTDVRWGSPTDLWPPGQTYMMMKPSRMLYWAGEYQRDSPPGEEVRGGYSREIHQRYGTTAGWQDVATASVPWRGGIPCSPGSEEICRTNVDFDASSPGAGKSQYTFDQRKALFALERSIHGGPVLGEGGNHWLYAGLLDGVEAQIGGFHRNKPNPEPISSTLAVGENAPLLVDFDLRKIHPLMVQFGVGYETRFFGFQESDCLPVNNPPPGCVQKRIYKSTATEIAFGHAGYLHTNSQGLSPDPTLDQEFNYWRLIYPLQQKYLLNQPTSILYDIDGQMVDASTAIRRRAPDLNDSHPVLTIADINRVKVTYNNGLMVFVNRDPTGSSWTVNLPAGYKWLNYSAQKSGSGTRTDFVGYGTDTGFTIPKDGWLAYQPATPPTVTPTPTPQSSFLNLRLKFQGIPAESLTPRNPKTIALTLKRSEEQIATYSATLNYERAGGTYRGQILLSRTPPSTYTALVKGEGYLRKNFGNLPINPGENLTPDTWLNFPQKAGDFNNDNRITIDDLGLILSVYRELSVPVNDQNQIYDVNADNFISIEDIALPLANYTDFCIPGDDAVCPER